MNIYYEHTTRPKQSSELITNLVIYLKALCYKYINQKPAPFVSCIETPLQVYFTFKPS
jgi:hypothetical protein